MISASRKVQNSLILSQFAIGNNASGIKKSGLSFAISNIEAKKDRMRKYSSGSWDPFFKGGDLGLIE